MSTVPQLPFAGRLSGVPSPLWWAALAIALTLTVAVHWIAGVVLLLVILTQRIAPLDMFIAYLLVVAGASFIDYTQGQLTAQLAVLSMGVVFTLYCYVVLKGRDVLTFRSSVLTLPLLLYLGLTLFNFARGVLAGNSIRFAGLELLAVLGLASSLLLAATRIRRDHVKFALVFLILLSLAHLAWGIHVYDQTGARTGILSFTPVPGVVAMIVFNLGLRARTGAARTALALTLAPLLVHQFISFTRGYWLSTAVGCMFSLIVYGGRGEGARTRWLHVLSFLGVAAVVAGIGAVVAGTILGYSDLGVEAAERFTSSFGTDIEYETGSNFVRLSEYLTASGHIADSPWFGHGLGFSFVQIEPFSKQVFEQWFVHQNYMLVWLKQGIPGVLVLIWLLVSGIRLGLRGRRMEDPVLASWCMGTAAASLYVLVYAMVHFPLGEVNTVFAIALLWGVTASLLNGDRWTFRWGRARIARASQPGAGDRS